MAEQIKVTATEPKMPPPPAQASIQSLEELQRLKAALDLEIAQKQLRALNRDEQKADDETARLLQEEENRRAVQASMMAAHKKRDRELKFAQDSCPHEKENKKTAIVGLRDSHNHYIFNCQNCMKMWTQDDCPPHLRPGMETVGGPQY